MMPISYEVFVKVMLVLFQAPESRAGSILECSERCQEEELYGLPNIPIQFCVIVKALRYTQSKMRNSR